MENTEAYLGPIRIKSGEFAGNEKEGLNRLLEVHFPGFQRIPTDQEDVYQVGPRKTADWKFAATNFVQSA